MDTGVNSLLSSLKSGADTIPRVTFFVILGKILQFQGMIKLPWERSEVCLSATKFLHKRDYKRFLFSSFEHADERDLYYNMASFLIKGRSLEKDFGGPNFALILVFLILLTNAFYIGVTVIGSYAWGDHSLMSYCTVGFSGVVFALKVITTLMTGSDKSFIMGVEVPCKHAAWAELIAIRQVVPSSPSLAYLAGILAGFAYIKTPLGLVVDKVIATLTGSHTKDLPYRKIQRS